MAVVTGYGSGGRDPASLKAIEGVNAAAEIRVINSLIAIANGDSIASKYLIGELPADAIIDPASAVYFSALTGVTDADIGFYYPNGGALILVDGVVNGHDIHLAGSSSLFAATGSGIATAANAAKRAWQLAGLTSNPGGNLALWLTINAAASAAGSVLCMIKYHKGA